jgi:hypothetical protein
MCSIQQVQPESNPSDNPYLDGHLKVRCDVAVLLDIVCDFQLARAGSFGQWQGADSSLESGQNKLLGGMGLPCLILELIPCTSEF